ncbi:hypothetical protein ACH5RR_001322 [Cinchona calisaya]|uniref:J domain-containing protein n=1 Tax=Cinchona calisaya TaxID=153742 RepID=A0ABD3B3I1_9GENT
MECNKDEARRAKEIAEKKMLNNDFDGAQRIALKAQQLFPELENITQLLAVCNVHCSADKRILGSEKDWYSILQVERLADEVTIKKQYRKLALVLHPDKNKFPGAEAAFKLIGEAHLVLSDRGKRSLFDSKVGISLKSAGAKPPLHQVKTNPPARKQFDVRNSAPDGFSTHYQSTQSNSAARVASFWTSCPHCNVKYLYSKDYVNRVLRCQKCSKPYVAYDIAAQGVFPGSNQSQGAAQGVLPQSNWSQPAVSKSKEYPFQGTYRTTGHKTAGSSASNLGSQGNTGSRTVGSVSGTDMRTTTKVCLDDKTKDDIKSVSGVNEAAGMPKEDVRKAAEAAHFINKSKKRGRQQEAESSESCDTSSSSDLVDITFKESDLNPAGGQSSGIDPFHVPRRSTRHKHQVSYNENGSDNDDFESPPKRSREGKSSSNGEGLREGIQNDAPNCANPTEQREKVPSKGGSSTGNTKVGKNQTTGKTAGALDHSAENVEIIDDSESDEDLCPQFINCLDPEFNDFDKGKEEICFAVDQFWACYDDVDGMPRFYAQIRKVYSTGFKLHITWLEADPYDQSEIDWANEELPVSCGKFRRGSSNDVTDRLTFSHQVLCEKGSAKGSFMIYPRKGETWALFKDWDIKWNSDPDNCKQYKYEIVEVVSDFVEGVGVNVVFLEKVRGFVSLFQQRSHNCIGSILIPPNQKFRFSHRIPSFKMSGTEKKGVPEGSFELDPACLPSNPDDICYPSVVDVDDKNLGAEGNSSYQEASKINKCKFSGSENTPKKPADFVAKSGYGEDTCKLRRSPRGLNDKKISHGNANVASSQWDTAKHLDGNKESRCSENTPKKPADFARISGYSEETCQLRRSPRGLKIKDKEITQANVNYASSQRETANHLSGNDAETRSESTPSKAGKEVHVQMYESSPNKSNSIHLSLSPGGKVSEELFYDFEDRSEKKFEVGKIWALYTPDHKLPKMYAQIKKIAFSPFMLYVAPLECCSRPEKDIQPVCGTFKVKNGKPLAFEPCFFSHLLEAKIINKNTVTIYPKGRQVWAVYRNWNAELSLSDLENCECQLVEIIDFSKVRVKVSPLVPVKYYKSVFRSRRIPRAGIETVDIQYNEIARFSHQVPAFQLTTEKRGTLAGAWQLDPASVPRNLGK